jgi:hypothetical protein
MDEVQSDKSFLMYYPAVPIVSSIENYCIIYLWRFIMKNIIKLFVFFVVSYSAFSEIETYSTYRIEENVEKPMYMHYDSNQDMMHIFGMSGTKGLWRMEKIINNTITGSERSELENIKLPFKPGFDNENGFVYIPFEGQIKRYNLYGDINEQEIASIDADAIDVAGTHLLLATNHNDGERGELQVYNVASGSVLQRVPAGYNFRDVKHYYTGDGNIGIALLSDNDLEGTSTVIHYGPIVHMGSFTLDSVIIDNKATEIKIKDSLLVATGGETDGIHLLNLNTGELTQHFLTLGSYNPKSSAFAGNAIYTATSYGDIRKTDLFTGDMKHIIYSSLDNFDFIEAYGDEWLYAADTENSLINTFRKTMLDYYGDYEEFEVGKEPVDVFFDDENYSFHVICKGFDANFNGEYEEEMGDEKPSWWRIESGDVLLGAVPGTGDVEKVMDFEFAAVKAPMMPFNIAVDNNNVMYIPLKNIIRAFSISPYDDFMESIDGQIDIDANSVFYDGQHLITTEQIFSGQDLVKVFEPGNSEPLMTLNAEENVAEAFDFDLENGKKGMIIGNVGDYSTPNSSTIQWSEFEHTETPEFTSYNVGSTLNDLDISGDYIGLTLDFSHTVKVIDVNEGPENMLTFNTGTKGWNGPRDVAVYDNEEYKYIYFTTYSGDVRKIDLNEGLMTEIYPTNSKAEGIAVSADYGLGAFLPTILATNISKSDYSSNNLVSVYFRYPSSVNEYKGKTVSSIKLYPNPSVDYVNIETDKILPGNSQIEVYNITGELLLSETVNSVGNTQFNFSSYDIPSGYYLLRIVNDDEIYTAPLEIQK